MIRDLGTMRILKEKRIKAEYIVIKIGDKVYSTSFSEIKTGKDIDVAMKQLVDTNGIGEQDNLWVKGKFTESKKHQKLDEEVPFEINVYTEIEDEK